MDTLATITQTPWHLLGFVASLTLPLFNLPLMYRLYQRKSSQDVSLIWVWGIFGSLVLMIPVGLLSTDIIFKIFTLTNALLFSGVTYLVIYYRIKK